MRKLIIAATAALCVAGVGTSFADKVRVDDPVGAFTDSSGNAGYVEADTDGAVRACNENEATPAGDSLTGWAYVSAAGEDNGEDGATYGNANIGADDADGDEGSETDGGNDCP